MSVTPCGPRTRMVALAREMATTSRVPSPRSSRGGEELVLQVRPNPLRWHSSRPMPNGNGTRTSPQLVGQLDMPIRPWLFDDPEAPAAANDDAAATSSHRAVANNMNRLNSRMPA